MILVTVVTGDDHPMLESNTKMTIQIISKHEDGNLVLKKKKQVSLKRTC